MGILSNLFKNADVKSTAANDQSNKKAKLLELNFIQCGNVYRNRDNSVPDLDQFLKLDFSIDDYVQFVHGKSQTELQNQLAFKNNAKRMNKKRVMEKRLKAKSERSYNKSKRIDGLQNEFYDFGMFAPYGVYHAANTFGLHTLNQYNLATGAMLGGVFTSMGMVDPSISTFDEALGGMNDMISNDMNDFRSSSDDLF